MIGIQPASELAQLILSVYIYYRITRLASAMRVI